MLRPKVVEWLKNPHLSETDVWMLCFTPRGCLIGLAVSGFTPLEKAADFNRRSLLKADGGLKPPSAQFSNGVYF